jgi:hypothetical protein
MMLVFPLAFVGYVLLAVTVVSHFSKRPSRWLHGITAVVILTHVLLVWLWRFDGSLAYAWEKNPVGFVLFHTALVLILLSTVLPLRWSQWLVGTAFPIVTAGALGATFRTEEVAVYRWPLLVVLLLTVLSCWYSYRRHR